MTRLTVPVAAAVAAAGSASQWASPPHGRELWLAVWLLVAGVGFAAAGCVVTAVHRASLPGWLLYSAGLGLSAAPTAAAVGLAALSEGLWTGVVLVLAPLALLHVVPRPRWVLVLDALLVAAGASAAVAAAAANGAVSAGMATVAGVVTLTGVWVLFETTAGDDRRRVLWVVLGSATTVPVGALLLIAMDQESVAMPVFAILFGLCSLALPVTAAVALIAPRVVDVRDVMHRASVLTVMFALVGALYVGVDAAVQAATGTAASRGLRVLVVFMIAVGYRPIMRWIRGTMDEMLFGGRADAVDTLARLGTHLAAGSTPPQWLDTLRAALTVPGPAGSHPYMAVQAFAITTASRRPRLPACSASNPRSGGHPATRSVLR
jgi:hypothetical protein